MEISNASSTLTDKDLLPDDLSGNSLNVSSFVSPPPIAPTSPTLIRGWSWGAFMFNWIWGVANKCYLPLLVFVPFFNIFWIFVCGVKGHDWAINSGTFTSVEEYNATQRSWNRAGLCSFIVSCVFCLIWFMFMFMFMNAMSRLILGIFNPYSY